MTKPIEVVAQLESTDKDHRRYVVVQHLESTGVSYELQKYDTGLNIVATIGNAPFVGIGSHYDVVDGSPGANDNGSAMAVTLDLLKRFTDHPLDRFGIKGFFFDEEEIGLLGSKAYVQIPEAQGVVGLYNMELVGMGDRIVLWPVNENSNLPLLESIKSQAHSQGIDAFCIDIIVTNDADHRSFRESGVDNAFTITTLSEADLEVLPEYFKALGAGADKDDLWKIMSKALVFQNYHQPTDTTEHLNDKTLQMVSDLIYNSILGLDPQSFQR